MFYNFINPEIIIFIRIKMQDRSRYAFFVGKYNNQYDCYVPDQYVDNNVNLLYGQSQPFLYTVQTHKQAVLTFMELFPIAKKGEKDAFMKVGYPLLQLEMV